MVRIVERVDLSLRHDFLVERKVIGCAQLTLLKLC